MLVDKVGTMLEGKEVGGVMRIITMVTKVSSVVV
jgi:hypothetical protein